MNTYETGIYNPHLVEVMLYKFWKIVAIFLIISITELEVDGNNKFL